MSNKQKSDNPSWVSEEKGDIQMVEESHDNDGATVPFDFERFEAYNIEEVSRDGALWKHLHRLDLTRMTIQTLIKSRRLVRKIDFRVLPILVLLFIVRGVLAVLNLGRDKRTDLRWLPSQLNILDRNNIAWVLRSVRLPITRC
jgi:hypothetical protein